MWERTGDSPGNVLFFLLFHCPCSARKKARDLCYTCIGKNAVQCKHKSARGKGCGITNWLSPQCGAFSRDLLDPVIPYGLGPWLQNDLCIILAVKRD